MSQVLAPSHAATGPGSQLGFAVRLALCVALAALLHDRLEGLFGAVYLLPMARAATALVYLAGMPATLDVSRLPEGFCTMATPAQLFQVEHACTGLFSLLIYLGAVAVYPSTGRCRVIGAMIGVPAFFAYGALRIAVLVLIGQTAPDWLPLWHAHLMVLLNLGFLLFLWSVWVNRCARRVG